MPDSRIRRIRPDDLERAVALVHELAAYEREPASCHLTTAQLERALFGPSPALFAHVAEVEGEVVGVALWFLSFSTWRGEHGIHLEDLYVSPDHRGTGLGKALLAALAEECVRNGYTRLEWVVLDWNEPAIGFYRSLGAESLDEWTTNRLSDAPLRALAGGWVSA